MNPFDICLAAHAWRKFESLRPFLLIRPLPLGDWQCFAISTKDYNGEPFEIDKDDADFPATGLRDTSYVYDFRFELVTATEFLGRWGRLERDLLARFRKESGV